MTTFHAFQKGIQLCHTHFSLLWIETGWRMVQFSLSVGFALLASYTLLEPVGSSDFEFESLENSRVAILKALAKILLRNNTLIFKTILLTLCFSVVIWLLLASFFQAGTLGLLIRQENNRETKARDPLGSGIVLALGFCRRGIQLFSPFLLINLSILFFSFTGSISFLVIIRHWWKLGYLLGETSSRFWIILAYGLATTFVFGIMGVALQFLEISKLCVVQYECSLLGAWNRSAEFLFANLKPMGAIVSLIHAVNLMLICGAIGFLGLIISFLGTEFLGAFLFLLLPVYFGYRLLKNYLFLIKSGSLLALIGQ